MTGTPFFFFFYNYEDSVKITGVNKNLLRLCAVIVQSSVTSIPNKYDNFPCQYVLQTTRLYVQQYSWFLMPISVHKILIHRSKTISTAILPTGQLSKEVQESQNKDLKSHKEGFNAKCHGRLVTFTSSFITSTEFTTPRTKNSVLHVFPRSFSIHFTCRN